MKHRILKLSAVLLICGAVGLPGVYAARDMWNMHETPGRILDYDWEYEDDMPLNQFTNMPQNKIVKEDFDDGKAAIYWSYKEGVQGESRSVPGDLGRPGLQIELDDDLD